MVDAIAKDVEERRIDDRQVLRPFVRSIAFVLTIAKSAPFNGNGDVSVEHFGGLNDPDPFCRLHEG